MEINDLFKKFIICLAPMASVGDFAFRNICAQLGADMVTTEMVSAKALAQNNKKTYDLLYEKPHSAIKCVQLFGHEENAIAKVLHSSCLDIFDIVDFNCGCPAPKIVKNGDGSAMMTDLQKTKQVIKTLVQNCNKPVSVKFRLGMNKVENYVAFGKMCEECGVSFLILHARMREQMYAGKVDIKAFEALKKAVNIPVIASGDIVDEKSLQTIYDMGLDGAMIGRAAVGDPFIFSRLKTYASKNKLNVYKTKHKKMNLKQAILQHFSHLLDYFKTEKKVISYFRKHLAWYVKNMPNANQLRAIIFKLSTKAQILEFINNNF